MGRRYCLKSLPLLAKPAFSVTFSGASSVRCEMIRGEGSDPNNASVVLRSKCRAITLLLTGDIEPAAQRALVAEGVDLQPTSSRCRTTVPPIRTTPSGRRSSPAWPCQRRRDNTYGHPDPELIDSMNDADVLVGRTDEDGSVALVVADEQLRLVSEP